MGPFWKRLHEMRKEIGKNRTGASIYYLASRLYEIITTASGKIDHDSRPRQALPQISLRRQKKNTSFLSDALKMGRGAVECWFVNLLGAPLVKNSSAPLLPLG